MEIRNLTIEGFKSIKRISLENPNPFSVFVGANAAGKSNIFEALELFEMCNLMPAFEAVKSFSNLEDIFNYQSLQKPPHPPVMTMQISIQGLSQGPYLQLTPSYNHEGKLFLGSYSYGGIGVYGPDPIDAKTFLESKDFKQWINFSRLFIDKPQFVKRVIHDDARLSLDASNLEKVLKRLLIDKIKKQEIVEILQLLIPGFKNIEVISEELSSSNHLLVYEENIPKPLPKHLISEGTYNIIAMVTALFQSDEPQFLCIEEPENGLNPKVVRELVNIFREKCEERGHYIWLNTHSQTLISELTTEEIIIVDKKEGLTEARQIKNVDLQGMRMDEALLTNAIGGGIPW